MGKKVMMRMTADKDATLTAHLFQAWQKGMVVIKQDNEFEKEVQAAEEQLAIHMENKSAQAKQVITRMLGSGDSGILMTMRQVWIDFWKSSRKNEEMDEILTKSNLKFSNLSTKQKKIVKNTADRTNEAERLLVLGHIFNHWVTQARVDAWVDLYTEKLDSKKNQLEAVQNLFVSFASQLEKDVSTTPRSQRKKQSSSRNESGTRHKLEGSHDVEKKKKKEKKEKEEEKDKEEEEEKKKKKKKK